MSDENEKAEGSAGGAGGETLTLPVLPLRDIVVFPHMIVPLFVGRDKSVRALDDVMQDDKHILLLTQKNASQDDPANYPYQGNGWSGSGRSWVGF